MNDVCHSQLGLEIGADDYLTKPFGIRELMARVGAIMRRHQRDEDRPTRATRTTAVSVELDPERRQATVRGAPVELTRQEFDLLYQLARRPGIVYGRAALRQNVWTDDTSVTERNRRYRHQPASPQDRARSSGGADSHGLGVSATSSSTSRSSSVFFGSFFVLRSSFREAAAA